MEHNEIVSDVLDAGMQPSHASSFGHGSWYHQLQAKLSHVEPWAFDLLVCGIVLFVIGFIAKNFGKMLVYALILAAIVGYGLHTAGYYAMPWADIQEWLGFAQIDSWSEAVDAVVVWIKSHPAGFASGLLGFMLGWKVG